MRAGHLGAWAALSLLWAPGLAAPAAGPAEPEALVPDWSRVRATRLADGLNSPMVFDVAGDGALWYGELYGGNVVRFDPATGSKETVWKTPAIQKGGERGLVGLLLDRQVEGAFYVFYTLPVEGQPEGGRNRLSRVEGGEETVLFETTAAKIHNGGRLRWALDGTLLVSVGDNWRSDPAQDPDSPLGKVLRLTRTGGPAPGNPSGGVVWTSGHRNAWGLAVDPRSGEVYATENSDLRRDEINLLRAGGNYGWPVCEGSRLKKGQGPCPDAYVPPLLEVYDNRTAAPTGITVFLGALYWASFNEGSIHRAWADERTGAWRTQAVFTPGGRIASLEAGPDGRTLYYSTWKELWKLEFPALPPGAELPYLGAALQPTAHEEDAPKATPGPGLAEFVVASLGLLRFLKRTRQARDERR